MPERKKLIEVALPLEAINREASREKSIRHGHPSTLHLWWARRPLAACRAVIWASLVDDPSSYLTDPAAIDAERQRLFKLLEKLVVWENSADEKVLAEARLEIARSAARALGVPVPIGERAVRRFLAERLPLVLDPFAGGGSISLEAQRLGLRAIASDLNPVAVLINKALIELPAQFADLPPVSLGLGNAASPSAPRRRKTAALPVGEWRGAQGLAEDVRFFGRWMRDQAAQRIGQLYPPYLLSQALLDERPDLRQQGYRPGDALSVIAWLWARTVTCPNPACRATMPLARSFVLSKNPKRPAWVEPIPDGKGVRFAVRASAGAPPQGTVGRTGARCLCCGAPVPLDHIRAEGKAGRLGAQLMAVVAEGRNGRVYLPPTPEHVRTAESAQPTWMPAEELQGKCRVSVPLYGMNTFGDLFTPRQLVALTTFSDLVGEAREQVRRAAALQPHPDRDPDAYADAVATYLAFAISKVANTLCQFSRWTPSREQTVTAFDRQALKMSWDFPEVNPFAMAAGDLWIATDSISQAIEVLPALPQGAALRLDARTLALDTRVLVSTDPPYYDNIGYADLSDFFYVWLRRSLGGVYPDLFATALTPKRDELVATPYRFGGDRERARAFFEDGLQQVFRTLRRAAAPDYPLVILYAYKQSEEDTDDEDDERDPSATSPTVNGHASTGWETLLSGLLEAGFQITGTWPLHTEMKNRTVSMGANALSTSIALVCRPRAEDAPRAALRDFLAALRAELSAALGALRQGAIPPVDLAQAAIGPGMAVFSRYRAVLKSDGQPLRVREALALINRALDELLAEQEGNYDPATRWALAWFEQHADAEGPYGDAETLSKAKNVSVDRLMEQGVVQARGGKVRLLRLEELDPPNPEGNDDLGSKPVWLACHWLARALDRGGERAAASLLVVRQHYFDW